VKQRDAPSVSYTPFGCSKLRDDTLPNAAKLALCIVPNDARRLHDPRLGVKERTVQKKIGPLT
jgi:hypothetical protein